MGFNGAEVIRGFWKLPGGGEVDIMSSLYGEKRNKSGGRVKRSGLQYGQSRRQRFRAAASRKSHQSDSPNNSLFYKWLHPDAVHNISEAYHDNTIHALNQNQQKM